MNITRAWGHSCWPAHERKFRTENEFELEFDYDLGSVKGLLEKKKSLTTELLEGGGENLLTELPDEEMLRFVALDHKSAVQE